MACVYSATLHCCTACTAAMSASVPGPSLVPFLGLAAQHLILTLSISTSRRVISHDGRPVFHVESMHAWDHSWDHQPVQAVNLVSDCLESLLLRTRYSALSTTAPSGYGQGGAECRGQATAGAGHLSSNIATTQMYAPQEAAAAAGESMTVNIKQG